jgi:uncharacterized membrane protein YkoI
MKPPMIPIAVLASVAALASGALAQAYAKPAAVAAAATFKGHELAGQAAVSIAAARAIALKALPGAVTDQELEKEGGGSGLRYSFDIRSHGRTHEVGVDAKTGKVLENKTEGKNPD